MCTAIDDAIFDNITDGRNTFVLDGQIIFVLNPGLLVVGCAVKYVMECVVEYNRVYMQHLYMAQSMSRQRARRCS